MWDTSWNSHAMRASWAFCPTSLRDAHVQDSHEVRVGKVQSSAGELHVSPFKVNVSICAGSRSRVQVENPLARASAAAPQRGKKTARPSRWATWQAIKSGMFQFVFPECRSREPCFTRQTGGPGDSKRGCWERRAKGKNVSRQDKKKLTLNKLRHEVIDIKHVCI